jgi:hypothetical protein
MNRGAVVTSLRRSYAVSSVAFNRSGNSTHIHDEHCGHDEYDSAPYLPSYPPFLARIGSPAPSFSLGAVVDNEITEVNLEDYRGKW